MADPHRAEDELRYHPGETNLRLADYVLINKENTADVPGFARSKKTSVKRIQMQNLSTQTQRLRPTQKRSLASVFSWSKTDRRSPTAGRPTALA